MRVRPLIAKQAIYSSKELAISLSGCGFLGTYHMGVAQCFYRRGQHLMERVKRVGGTSSGSLVAALLLLAPNKLDSGLKTIYDMAEELHNLPLGALTPGYCLQDRLIHVVDSHIPHDISKAQDKLIVSMTTYDAKENYQMSQYKDRAHLIKCLMASCYIPGYSRGITAEPPLVDGITFFDGFYSNNLPEWSDIRTITVSPFSGDADVAPEDPDPWTIPVNFELGRQKIRVNIQNLVRGKHALFPPPVRVLQQYFQLGYNDAKKFLEINQLTDEDVEQSVNDE